MPAIQYYHPHQNIVVDECIVATKARTGMKQYMKDKPTKWGCELFVLADSLNGYSCDFSIYEGKAQPPSGKGLSFDVETFEVITYMWINFIPANGALVPVEPCGRMVWTFHVPSSMSLKRKKGNALDPEKLFVVCVL